MTTSIPLHNGHPVYYRGEFTIYFRDGLWRLRTTMELGSGKATAQEQIALAELDIANEAAARERYHAGIPGCSGRLYGGC